MLSYTEFCNAIADYLGLKSDVIFIAFPKECYSNFYYSIRENLPTAHIASIGTCAESTVQASLEDIETAINNTKHLANKNAFVIFSMIKTSDYYINELKLLIDNIRKSNLRPALITFTPYDFWNESKLGYDEIILLNPDISAEVFNNPYLTPQNINLLIREINKNFIEKVKNVLLPYKDESTLNINAKLGNGPLIFSHTKPDHQAINLPIIDIFVFLFLAYSLYQHVKNTNKNSKKLKHG